MFLVRLCLFVCVNLFFCAKCSIPVERLCVNPACTEPISLARGKIRYTSHSKGVLSFDKSQEILITSKSENAKDYWGAVINGRSGYVPSDLVLERKIYHERKNLIRVPGGGSQPVPAGEGAPLQNDTFDQLPAKPQGAESVVGNTNNPHLQKPIKPDKTFNVVEGTTIYADEPEEITPSSTLDVKAAGQTVAPMSASVKDKDDAQERATIPPEILNLNSNYREQAMQKGGNFTIEKVKENDENVVVESRDMNGDEDGEEDEKEEEEDEEDDEEEEEEENLEEELQENLDNQLGEAKENKIVMSDGSESVDGRLAGAAAANSHSPVGENTSQTVVNVVESSVTSKVSASVGDSPAEAEALQFAQPVTQPYPQTEGVRAEVPTQDHPSTWRMLNIHKNSFPAAGNAGVMPGTPQPILSEPPQPSPTPHAPQPLDPGSQRTFQQPQNPPEPAQVPPTPQTTPSGSPDSNTMPSAPLEPLEAPVELQIVPSGSRNTPEPPATPSPSQATPPQPLGGIPAEPQQHQRMPPPPPTIPPHPLDAQPPPVPIQQPLNAEAPPPPQAPQTEAPAPADFGPTHNLSDAANQVLDPVAEPLEPLHQSTPQSAPDTPTIFTQFSVSADALPENSSSDNPSLTPDMTQEKPEATTEASPETPHPLPAAPEEQFSGPPAWQEAAPQGDVTPNTLPEAAEVAAEATVTPAAPPPVAEEPDVSDPAEGAESAPGVLSQITAMFSSWFTPPPREEPPAELSQEAAFADAPTSEQPEGSRREASGGPGKCPDAGGECEESSEEQAPFWSGWVPSGWGAEGALTPSNTFTYLVVTAVTVLLFTLGHNFIEKRGKTGPLIAKINKLEHEFLVSSKECVLLKEEVQSLREKIVLYENSANDELVLSLQAELDQSKKARSELEGSIEVLQQELDAATEAGMDLNKMLSEVLTQKGGSESLLKSVESLQAQLDSQQRVIDEMTKKLGVKNQEIEALQTALEAANERAEGSEEQLGDMRHNLNLHLKEKEDVTRELSSQISQLSARMKQLGEAKEKEVSRVKKQLEEAQRRWQEASGALTVREEELRTLKESVQLLKGGGEGKVEAVFDVSRVRGELAKEVKEKQGVMERLQKEESGRKALGEQVKALEGEMQRLRKGCEEAEQRREEAEKKLEVLSTYFKEKETQLQKELGMQEALWAQKKGDEKAVYNMMKSLQEEVESYKSQNETLKKEILDQERGLKNQMATLEKKAHENWVAARQAERKLEETKQETAQLRNRLTRLEKNSSSEELNGVEATSPVMYDAPSPIMHDTPSPHLFPPLPIDPNNSSLLPPGFIPHPMFMPPLMGGFMPPLPFLPGDRRPPPLGRMSSPPLYNRVPSSSPSLSPPGTNYSSPNEDREHYRQRTPPDLPPLHPRNWDDSD